MPGLRGVHNDLPGIATPQSGLLSYNEPFDYRVEIGHAEE
jgi:hypothetical protein